MTNATELFYSRYGWLYLAMIDLIGHRRSIKQFFRTKNILHSGMSIVDAGCGSGVLTQKLFDLARVQQLRDITFYGFDITQAMLDRFTQWIKTKQATNITIAKLNVLQPPPKDRIASADLLVSSGMLEYLPKKSFVDGLNHLRLYLKPNGKMFIFISKKSWMNHLIIQGIWQANLYNKNELETTLRISKLTLISITSFRTWGYVIEASPLTLP